MKQSLTFLGLSVLALLTTACGATPGFSTVDVSSEGKISSISSTIAPSQSVPAPTPAPGRQPNSEPTPVLRYNFVAGSKVDCEDSIRARFGIQMSCSIGGGCAITGEFPSAQFPSANPQHWGACFDR
jgi:hypothetical protein